MPGGEGGGRGEGENGHRKKCIRSARDCSVDLGRRFIEGECHGVVCTGRGRGRWGNGHRKNVHSIYRDVLYRRCTILGARDCQICSHCVSWEVVYTFLFEVSLCRRA